ncbi:MAG: hypothetical protein IB616_01225 [Methanosarcinales archaeon]|nr:MAG: hypothetical protein IB616_01225 [Methanosarcinales archaeon]
MKMLAPVEIKIGMIMLIATLAAVIGCSLPVSQTTGATIIYPIQLVILITLTLQIIRITLKEEVHSRA